MNEQNSVVYRRKIYVGNSFDVIVCGGGPAGCAAALAARRAGLKVLLVEAQGQLGGTGTSGLVSHWLGGRLSDGQWVVGGLFREMSEEVVEHGFALLPRAEDGQVYTPHGWNLGLIHGVPFDPFAMSCYLDKKMAEVGVEVLLMTQVVDAVVEDDRIASVIIFNKSGLSAASAKAFIDSTGDADVAARSGCKVVKGREEDGLMTPTSLEFHVDNVDQDALSAYIHEHKSPRFRKKIQELRQSGEWPFPYDIFISVQLNQKGTMMINTTRICEVDGTDGISLTDGLMRGRDEIMELFQIMRKHFPGFADARIKAVAPMLGVRETRRIVGDYVLTVDDLVSGRDFPDTIGFSMYGWDLPDPKKPSYQPFSKKKISKSRYTPIPYRIMLPQPIDNLICPGRAVSVERHVLGPLRVMAPCMAMGEAAGQAAEQVARKGIAFYEVDTELLRQELSRNGAIVDVGMIAGSGD